MESEIETINDFWESLGEKLDAIKELEATICANLMGEEDYGEEASFALEELVFHVTTEFPVSEAEGYSPEDANTVIELATYVSEKFMTIYDVRGLVFSSSFVFIFPFPYFFFFFFFFSSVLFFLFSPKPRPRLT
jgi:hypothetical protein